MGRLRCRLLGHKWTVFSDGYKRQCQRCEAEEWVFSKPYPKIGEAKYFWQRVYGKGAKP